MSKIVWLMIALGMICGGTIYIDLFGGALCWAADSSAWPATQPVSDPVWITGTLSSVDGKSLTLLDKDQTEENGEIPKLIVTTDESTTFSIDYERVKLQDLQAGMSLYCVAWKQASRPPKLFINASRPSISGSVLKIDGKNVVLAVGATQEMTTVVTDENTKIFYWPDKLEPKLPVLKEGTLADLQPDMEVCATPNVGVAKKIFVITISDDDADTATKPSQ